MLIETKMKQKQKLTEDKILTKLQRDGQRDNIEMITFIRHVPLIVPVPAFHFRLIPIS